LSILRFLRGSRDSGAGTFAAVIPFARHRLQLSRTKVMPSPASRRSGDAAHADAAVGRRNLMRGLVAGAAAVPALTGVAASPPDVSDNSDPRVVRYRETDHVRSFYRRARF
jgi:hypothetical protein